MIKGRIHFIFFIHYSSFIISKFWACHQPGFGKPCCCRANRCKSSPMVRCCFAPLSVGEGLGVRAPGFPLMSLTQDPVTVTLSPSKGRRRAVEGRTSQQTSN